MPSLLTRPKAGRRGGLTLELRQVMQERTPLWPLKGYKRSSQNFPGSAPSPLPAQAGVRAPHPTPTGMPASLSHPHWLRASPGASPQLQSQFPQGLVQLIMHQVDLLSSQPEQLGLAQGKGGSGYCPLPRGCCPNSGLPQGGAKINSASHIKKLRLSQYPRPCSN